MFLLAGAGVASRLTLGAATADFWNKKAPADWTTEEIDRLITKSPWAKQVKAQYAAGEEPLGDDAESPGTTTKGRYPGGSTGPGGGYPGGGTSTGTGGYPGGTGRSSGGISLPPYPEVSGVRREVDSRRLPAVPRRSAHDPTRWKVPALHASSCPAGLTTSHDTTARPVGAGVCIRIGRSPS